MTVTTFSSDEQKAAYVAGADAAAEAARLAYARALDVQAPAHVQRELYQEVRHTIEHAHSCRIQVYGVTCPRCGGDMTLPGKMPWDAHDCPVCKTWGKVLPEVAAAFWRRHGFSSADAAEMAAAGVTVRTVDDYTPNAKADAAIHDYDDREG